MSYREFLDWQVYFKLFPYGDLPGSMRAGLIAATTANVNRDPERAPEPFTPLDFNPIPTNGDERPPAEVRAEKEALLRRTYQEIKAINLKEEGK